MIRSFLAFELPEEFKRIISRASGEMKKSLPNVRWVKLDNIHLTVVFIGEMAEEQLAPMGKSVSEACWEHVPFNIAINGAGVFSSRRNPRVLWIGLDGDIERMAAFRNTLQKKLKPFGIKEEKRPFNPHLTLGRFRKGAEPDVHLDDLLLKYKDLTSPACALRELALFKSDLKPGGAVYTKLNAWPLGHVEK